MMLVRSDNVAHFFQDIQALEEEKQKELEDLRHKLESQDAVIRELTTEINDLKSSNKGMYIVYQQSNTVVQVIFMMGKYKVMQVYTSFTRDFYYCGCYCDT